MANQAVDGGPIELTGIVIGTTYFVQNVGSRIAYIELATSAPTDFTNAFLIQPWESLYIKADPGESAYVWATGPTRLVYSEALS